jgi:hypothetical protein
MTCETEVCALIAIMYVMCSRRRACVAALEAPLQHTGPAILVNCLSVVGTEFLSHDCQASVLHRAW